jgi:hypothetical protein
MAIKNRQDKQREAQQHAAYTYPSGNRQQPPLYQPPPHQPSSTSSMHNRASSYINTPRANSFSENEAEYHGSYVPSSYDMPAAPARSSPQLWNDLPRSSSFKAPATTGTSTNTFQQPSSSSTNVTYAPTTLKPLPSAGPIPKVLATKSAHSEYQATSGFPHSREMFKAFKQVTVTTYIYIISEV